jgi:hypothetical protein
MVMMIGFLTMGALVWVLASGMARESDARKRRATSGSHHDVLSTNVAVGKEAGQAA